MLCNHALGWTRAGPGVFRAECSGYSYHHRTSQLYGTDWRRPTTTTTGNSGFVLMKRFAKLSSLWMWTTLRSVWDDVESAKIVAMGWLAWIEENSKSRATRLMLVWWDGLDLIWLGIKVRRMGGLKFVCSWICKIQRNCEVQLFLIKRNTSVSWYFHEWTSKSA